MTGLLPMSTTMASFQIFRATIMSLNQQYISSDVVHQSGIVTAFRFQVSHPPRYLQRFVMDGTFQFQFESTHRTPHKHLAIHHEQLTGADLQWGVKKYLWFRFPTDPIIFSTRLTVRPYLLQVVAGCCQNGVCCHTNY
jgi:hypothetical protein